MNSNLDINRLEELSCLSLTDAEKEAMLADFRSFFAFCDVLSQIDDLPCEAGSDIAGVLREDVPAQRFAREDLLAATQTKENGYITVPLVMKDR